MIAVREYILRHWNGENTLAYAYWVNNVALSVILIIAVKILSNTQEIQSIYLSASLGLIYYLIIFPVFWVWVCKGLWETTRKRIRNMDRVILPYLVQVLIVISVIQVGVIYTNNYSLQIVEFVKILSGNDPYGKASITLLQDKKSALLTGGIGAGSSGDVEDFLVSNPNVNRFVLDSPGGRLAEVKMIAALVKQQQINTYVEGQCLSGCTFIFLSGKERSATPKAKLGFHSPTLSGIDDTQQQEANKMMGQFYRNAHLSESFITKALNTPSNKMWFPSHQELIDNRVVTKTSSGGESSFLLSKFNTRNSLKEEFLKLPVFNLYEKRFPGIMNGVVEKTWAAKKAGKTDAESMALGRSVITNKLPELITTSTSGVRNEFLNLLITQMNTANAISGDMCIAFLQGKATSTAIFDKNLIDEELRITSDALKLPPIKVSSISNEEFGKLIPPIISILTQEQKEILASGKLDAADSSAVCNTYIDLYTKISEQPSKIKDKVFVYMLSQ